MTTASEALEQPHVDIPTRWRPDIRGWVARLVVLIVIFGGFLLLTASVPGFWADRIARAAIWAIIGLSLNVVLGYVGQVSLGHHAFVGIAAFVSAYYVTEKAGCLESGCDVGSVTVAILVAVLSGAVAAGLLGVVALRIKGLYLALITLAYGFVAERSIFEIPELTRGGAGMPAPRPTGFQSDTKFAFLCFVVLAVVIFVDWRLVRSKVGRAILSVKHSEQVAASYGINVTAYKILAFIVSGGFAGLAGAMLAFHATRVVSNDFTFATGLLWVLMVVVGGLGNRTGVVIGSMFFALFPFLFDALAEAVPFFQNLLPAGRRPEHFSLVLGAALAILTIVQYPGGIGEQLSPLTRWLRGQKFSVHPEGHGKHKPKPSLRKRFGAPKEQSGPSIDLQTVGTKTTEIPTQKDTAQMSPVPDKERG